MSADVELIEFIKTPFIQEYQWQDDGLLIWVSDYEWADFKANFKELCSFDEGGIPAQLQENCIFIDLSKTEFLNDYFEELKAGFPEV